MKLDEDSSYLTTFNTPFGRYRWLRMPFGINSAPEEWQRRAHELAEGLEGVEVVADDFLCIGFDATVEEATRDHDANMRELLERARACHLVLNPDKVKMRSKSVPFIGHIFTDEGLKVDESKVEAIMKMPAPTDIAALMRILGMVGYLAKFLPHLSEVCEPLRQLDRKDVEWCWLEQHQDALTKIRELITAAPVLAYYDVMREVTIQCDASQSGLGAVLLQEGRPVCYASRALTTTEENYAHVEKELLAIVFSCEKFDQYVYGRHITVQSDKKPLEIITKKSMIDAPKRLQRMLLRLQKYDIDVVYTRGKEMHIADALSRAYLPYCHTHDTGDHVLAVEQQKIDHVYCAVGTNCRRWLPYSHRHIYVMRSFARWRIVSRRSKSHYACSPKIHIKCDIVTLPSPPHPPSLPHVPSLRPVSRFPDNFLRWGHLEVMYFIAICMFVSLRVALRNNTSSSGLYLRHALIIWHIVTVFFRLCFQR